MNGVLGKAAYVRLNFRLVFYKNSVKIATARSGVGSSLEVEQEECPWGFVMHVFIIDGFHITVRKLKLGYTAITEEEGCVITMTSTQQGEETGVRVVGPASEHATCDMNQEASERCLEALRAALARTLGSPAQAN